MSRRNDSELIADILEAINRISDYCAGTDYDSFVADLKTQDAVVRNLEVIGEAAKKISSTAREKHPNIPWRSMAGLRDRLIHDYFGVNLDIVWEIITRDLPEVLTSLASVRSGAGDE